MKQPGQIVKHEVSQQVSILQIKSQRRGQAIHLYQRINKTWSCGICTLATALLLNGK